VKVLSFPFGQHDAAVSEIGHSPILDMISKPHARRPNNKHGSKVSPGHNCSIGSSAQIL
jgi:hypothetical protein